MEPRPKRVLVYFELERTHVVTKISIFDTFCDTQNCLNLKSRAFKSLGLTNRHFTCTYMWTAVCKSSSHTYPVHFASKLTHPARFIFSSFFSFFLFVPCGGLSWLHVSFLLHVKYTLSYRIQVKLLCCYVLKPKRQDYPRYMNRTRKNYTSEKRGSGPPGPSLDPLLLQRSNVAQNTPKPVSALAPPWIPLKAVITSTPVWCWTFLVRRRHWETEHLPSPDRVSGTAFLLPSLATAVHEREVHQ